MTLVNASGQPVASKARREEVAKAGIQKQYLGLIGSELMSVEDEKGQLIFTQHFIARIPGTGTPEVPEAFMSCGRFMYAVKINLTENVTVVMLASDNGAQPAQMNVVLTQGALRDYILALAKLITEPTDIVFVPSTPVKDNGPTEGETDNAEFKSDGVNADAPA